MERPTKVEVGQRWCTAKTGANITIASGGGFEWMDKDGNLFTSGYLLERCTYLGSASTPPAPASGQRWRVLTECDGLTIGGVFTLTRDASHVWKASGPTYSGKQVDDWNVLPCRFTDGRLQYVDSGPGKDSGNAFGSTVQVGQRRKSSDDSGVLLRWEAFTIDGKHTDGRWKYRYDGNPNTFYRAEDEILVHSVLLDSDTRASKEAQPKESLSSPQTVPSVFKPLVGSPSAPAVPKPARREVSTDGKHWIDFDRLTDGDAFEAYPWRRERFGDVVGVTEPQRPLVYEPPNVHFAGAFTFEGGEKTSRMGTPITALKAVRERQKPGRWVPSVDDFDLLPDAGR